MENKRVKEESLGRSACRIHCSYLVTAWSNHYEILHHHKLYNIIIDLQALAEGVPSPPASWKAPVVIWSEEPVIPLDFPWPENAGRR
jgi:hypothetical protein